MRTRLERAIDEYKDQDNDIRKKVTTGRKNTSNRLTGPSVNSSPNVSPGLRQDSDAHDDSTMFASFFENPSDRIIYQPKAFEGNQIFIYEEDARRIHPEELLELIMNLIDEDIQK